MRLCRFMSRFGAGGVFRSQLYLHRSGCSGLKTETGAKKSRPEEKFCGENVGERANFGRSRLYSRLPLTLSPSKVGVKKASDPVDHRAFSYNETWEALVEWRATRRILAWQLARARAAMLDSSVERRSRKAHERNDIS